MDKKIKAGSKTAEITGKVVALLEPLSSEDRQRVITASLTLLGEVLTGRAPGSGASGPAGQSAGESSKADQNSGDLPVKAKSWLRQTGLTMTQLEQVFNITSDGVTVIASEVPGKNKKEQTHNAYVLQGLSQLLASGDASFDDKSARQLCEDSGCYDANNHSTYMNDKRNVLTGSKKTGWKLTAPGLKHGANLVKQLTKEG